MDPDALLGLLRAAIGDARAATDEEEELEVWQHVGELFESLDEWLTKGGFSPWSVDEEVS